MFNPNPAFPLLQMLMKSAPKGFTPGVNADIEKNSSICPNLALNAEHYDLVFSPRQKKKGYHQIWEANLQPLGTQYSLISCFQCSSIYE
jgi:hypothetical protein